MAWKKYYEGCWLKEIQESMDICTGTVDITKVSLKGLKTPDNQSINQSYLLDSLNVSICFTS